MTVINCLHKNAYGGWSHSEYLIYCPDCGQEIAENEVSLTEATKEDIKDHVEGEVIHDRNMEMAMLLDDDIADFEHNNIQK